MRSNPLILSRFELYLFKVHQADLIRTEVPAPDEGLSALIASAHHVIPQFWLKYAYAVGHDTSGLSNFCDPCLPNA